MEKWSEAAQECSLQSKVRQWFSGRLVLCFCIRTKFRTEIRKLTENTRYTFRVCTTVFGIECFLKLLSFMDTVLHALVNIR